MDAPVSPARRGRPAAGASAAERRRKLCRAAISVAMRDGIAGLTTRAVAQEAGLTAAMVNYEFASKDGLLLAVLEEIHAGVRATLAASVADSRSLADALARVAASYWAHVQETPDLQRVQYELTLHTLTLEGGEALARAQYEGYVQALAAALGAIADRPLRSTDLEDLAGACVALMDGLILQWLATRDADAVGRRLATGVRVLQLTASFLTA